MERKETNLFIALGAFIQAMRLFISTELKSRFGDNWERKYFDKLLPQLQEAWGKNLQAGFTPEYLIDFGNLNSFSIGAKKEFFWEHFGKKSHNLPAIFNELAEVRNMTAHYLPIDDDKAEKAYLHMIGLAKDLEMSELETLLRKLKRDSFSSRSIPSPSPASLSSDSQKIGKSAAIKHVNDAIGNVRLFHKNTVFSNINKSVPRWWLNIPPSKFESELNILLVEKKELIWIYLPKNSCSPPENFFNTRKDNGKIDLSIGIEGDTYLKDTLGDTNFSFRPFVKERLSIL
ncbi:Swt1 family HEPN domain-containing protein [Robiginitalea biformata]|uniref:Swt1-like HEPN domain-containing protein n=1 Tax=Robiginitalea biformata (strain ATCC BAA-864 / DSM 15991 / KCTC 12146 / HTCC2501) TaxID=313596 RepID=A4CHR7_ROBBH|nr:Swt1 family HEPN domain-containing protein [Robiginitalea biformata]EAR16475.1 hypothetical protein RB2501_06235 [Robiginitalea biformata HTCC2501]